ncbi:MAG: type IX secretion system sortase PorU [Bacteroidales bacterium]
MKRSISHIISRRPDFFIFIAVRAGMIRYIIIILSLLFPFHRLISQEFTTKSSYASTEPAQASVLASGKWYKIKVYKDGVYRLTFEDISNMGFSDPSAIRVFGNGGKMIPLLNSDPRYDDLIENSIYINKGSDGIFNAGDFILFYAKGPVTWSYNSQTTMYDQQVNLYSNASYYFLTTEAGSGKKISTRPTVQGNPQFFITSFNDYACYEKNNFNLLKSGRQWFGKKIHLKDFDTTFVFSNLETTSPVKLKIQVASRAASQKYFSLSVNGQALGMISLPAVVLDNFTGVYATQKSALYTFSESSSQLNLKLTYNNSGTSDEDGYLDYVTINARRKISMTDDFLLFRDRSYTGNSAVARYTVENCNENTEIWDVTDPFTIRRMPVQHNGSVITFTDSTFSQKEYLAVNTKGAFGKPEINGNLPDLGDVPNQNLHASSPYQMIIVSHPLFLEAADSIAQLHRVKDNLSVLVVNADQVYNEFSSGIADIGAIRDFTRMIYNRSTSEADRLKYLLLLGDGSYNNMAGISGNSNFIPTYQSENSLDASFSYVSDDFYGFLEAGEGGSESMGSFTLDIGTGRLPAKSPEEAMALYRKIKHYTNNKTMKDWRNNILFVGDDEDGNLHMAQANGLADIVGSNYPRFAIRKVMLDAYPQVSSSSGASYPEASRIILNNIRKGLLVFNYTGHGSEAGLAHEHILMGEDLKRLENIDNLPLFVTATCEFSRFDDLKDVNGTFYENTSAGELSLVNPAGGSIALITTTRIVYSDDNHKLNTKLYDVIFEKDSNGNYYKLGDILKTTKNAMGTNRNKLNFILLGDPALTLAIPKYHIVTDSLNGTPVDQPTDTLKAFSRIRISGHVEDDSGNLLETFNGTVYPSVFDKMKKITTLANDQYATPMQFNAREDLLYKGKASVVNGRFTFEFMVPRDITYSYGNGKIIYYSSDQQIDASGYMNHCVIGGTDESVVSDESGPDISLYLDDEYFNNEGITNPNPVIYAIITDESGINTIGNGIGHDITGVIDGDVSNPIILNDYFEANLDDFTSGILKYPMQNLEEGWHSLRLKVWDVFNNSGEEIIEFKVISGNSIIIANAGNFPNPASDYTQFTFEHNLSGETLTVNISVYDMAGRLVANFNEDLIASGFNTRLSAWDLTDQNGNKIKQGIYPYRITIIDGNGRQASSHQKLVVIRQ